MEIRITNSKQSTDPSGKSYILFSIIVNYGEWQTSVEHRYSEFLELHRVMKLMRRVFNSPLPRFPGQKIWKQIVGNLTEEDIEQRRRELEVYMGDLALTDCARHSQYFTEFLGMPQDLKDNWMNS